MRGGIVLLGDDTYYLTGTDEHGQKIERSAAAAGVPPQEFADAVSKTFSDLWVRMGITNDGFIRTTSECHKKGVQKLFKTLQDKGAIYLDTYTGQYCVSDEAFVDVAPGERCPDCGNMTETITESNYYFRLSQYGEKIAAKIESGELLIQPESRRNEVLSFVKGGLKDLSISRTSFKWGIPVPGDEAHVIYVWLDALANYMTAVGYGSDDPAEIAKFERYWPADIHLVGKEIIRFHCVYWPAFLMAAELPLPKSIVANGWLLFEESKMSKSKGNVVRAETILDAFGGNYSNELQRLGYAEPTKADQDLFGTDVLRYFLLREIPFGQDGSFSFDSLWGRYNSDLSNGYGNLVSRTLAMIGKYYKSEIPNTPERSDPSYQTTSDLIGAMDLAIGTVPSSLDSFQFEGATTAIVRLTAAIDGYLTKRTPWKAAAEDEPVENSKRETTLYFAAAGIRVLTALAYPILPYATAKGLGTAWAWRY